MGAVHTSRFIKCAYNTDGESNLVQLQKYIKWLKTARGKVHWMRLSSDMNLKQSAEYMAGILSMHELPGRLSKTNNARRRVGLPTRRKPIDKRWRTFNPKDWE